MKIQDRSDGVTFGDAYGSFGDLEVVKRHPRGLRLDSISDVADPVLPRSRHPM